MPPLGQRPVRLPPDDRGHRWPAGDGIGSDSDYLAMYKACVGELAPSTVDSAALATVIDTRAALIRSAVTTERSGCSFTSSSAFTVAVAALKTHVASRQPAALAFAG